MLICLTILLHGAPPRNISLCKLFHSKGWCSLMVIPWYHLIAGELGWGDEVLMYIHYSLDGPSQWKTLQLSKPMYCYAFVPMKQNRQTLETEVNSLVVARGWGWGWTWGWGKRLLALGFLMGWWSYSEMSGNGVSVTLWVHSNTPAVHREGKLYVSIVFN